MRKGKLIAPPLSAGVLESITRDTMLTLAREQLAIETKERDIDRSELAVADEAFFLGTGWELLSMLDIDGLVIGDSKPGAVATDLTRVYRP